MTYLHCRVQIPIPIRTANKIATLNYVHLFTLQSWIQIPILTVNYMKVIGIGVRFGIRAKSLMWCSVTVFFLSSNLNNKNV